jgi:hypothetical protein
MTDHVVEAVTRLYAWIDEQVAAAVDPRTDCHACGRCCDFAGYDHQLYVTTPEWLYFREKQGAADLRPMTADTCPYLEEGRCTVHAHRFAGCRIFGCRRSEALHSRLTETALKRLKSLCTEQGLPYRYADLATALNDWASDTSARGAESPPACAD